MRLNACCGCARAGGADAEFRLVLRMLWYRARQLGEVVPRIEARELVLQTV